MVYYQKDKNLGLVIHKMLQSKNLENSYNKSLNFDEVAKSSKSLLKNLGFFQDDSTEETPKRMSKFFINELFYGLDYENFPKITTTENKFNYHNQVYSQNINFVSTCEHHFVLISGNAYISYIPKNKIIGLSKLNRVVDFFAKRPQVQERATLQIFETLKYILEIESLAVAIKSSHYCIKIRGVNDKENETLTYKICGDFESDKSLFNSFFKFIN